MNARHAPERIQTIVIGGGQAGLAVGYHLARAGLPFVILDAHHRVGDSWRMRWDSMRLFTPASHDGLPGLRFPAPRTTYPTKDEMADYLENYAARFELPIRLGVRVDALAKNDRGYVVAAGDLRFEADNVVVAIPTELVPSAPPFSRELAPELVQLHSFDYRNPGQLQDGPVLVVGAGNSGADIAIELVSGHHTWLSGRHPGHIPFPLNRLTAGVVYPLVRFGFHHVLTVRTPPGRKLHAKLDGHGKPLVRVKPKYLENAGIERVPPTVGVRDGLPLLEDGRALEAANVVWCTGFRPDFSWIDLPVFNDSCQPAHARGIVESESGLYFVGLDFLYAASSSQINGIGRDAEHVVSAIAALAGERRPPADRHARRQLGASETAGADHGEAVTNNLQGPPTVAAEPAPRAVEVHRAYERVLAGTSVCSRFVRAGAGRRIHLLEKGAGPPLVLLHGTTASAAMLVPLLDELEGVHAIAVDRPGHGLSDPIDLPRNRFRAASVEWVDGLLDVLELGAAALVGHSGGAVWALWYALAHPDRVTRLVLMGPPAMPKTRCPLPIRLAATPGLGRLLARLAPPTPKSVLRFASFMGEKETLARHPDLVDLFVATGRDPIADRAGRVEIRTLASPFALVSPSGFRHRGRVRPAELRELTMPALVVWGEREPLGSVSVAQAVTELFPRGQLVVLPGGHAPWLGHPTQTAATVANFAQ